MARYTTRRTLVKALGAGSAVGLAGCAGTGATGPSNTTANGTTTTPTPTNGTGTTEPSTTTAAAEGAKPLDDFEDLSKWKTVKGKLTAATDRAYRGSQSARVTAPKGAGTAWIRRDVDWDLANRKLSLAIHVEKPIDKVIADLRLHAPDANNTVTVGEMIRVEPKQQWYRLDLGTRTIDGSPDLSKVTKVDLRLRKAQGPIDFRIDDLGTVAAPKKGAVAFTFDDGLRSQYEKALPIFEKHGVPASVAMVTGNVGKKGSLTLDQLGEMQKAGWTVASHGHNHIDMTKVATQTMWQDVIDAHDWLVNHGFKKGAKSLVYPYGRWDHQVVKFAKKYHDAAYRYLTPYGAGSGPVTGPMTVSRGDGSDPAKAKSMLNFAQFYDDVQVFTFHGVGTGDTLSVPESGLEELVSYAAQRDIEVVTYNDLRKNYLVG